LEQLAIDGWWAHEPDAADADLANTGVGQSVLVEVVI
jgi:hypothetical protein